MAEEDKKLLGSETKEKLLSKISDVGQSISQRAQEDDPDSWSDEAARLAVGTAKTAGAIAGAPVIKETLSVLDFPFYMLRQSAGAVMEHGFGVDPFYGQAAVGVGEFFVGGKALTGVAKTATKGIKKVQAISKAEDIMNLRRKQELGLQMVDKIDNPLYRNVDDLSLVDEVLAAGDDVIYPPGSREARIQAQYQASRQVPSGMTPQETRGWFARFTRPRILEIGEELGGSPKELRRIAKEQAVEFKDMENTISELNHMWRVWGEGRSLGFENSQIVVKKMKDGTERLVIKDWKGPDKDWETFAAFNKDHIRAVINANLPGGGLYGANMAANLEALFAAANRRKSNLFQLDEKILKNIGVPKNAETYIFRKLHPEYTKLERLIPTFWRESYVKNILNDYYEAVRKLPKKRWNAKMNQLVRKYTHLYRDKAFIEGLEGLQRDLDKLMQSNIARGISGKEIPEWMEDLTMPPGGFNSKDPWWLDLPLAARRRWKRAADQKRIQLMFDPEYKPSKGRYRIKPDD